VSLVLTDTAVASLVVPTVCPQVLPAGQRGGRVAQGRQARLDLSVGRQLGLQRGRLGLQLGERHLLDRHQLGDDAVDVQAAADAG
jgi:hypothetical protein